MIKAKAKLKAQMSIFKEMENQLLIQAERLGIREDYSPLRLKELEAEALNKHLLAFYTERSNLEYEMQMLGTDKREVLIKMERLGVYIRRAEQMVERQKKELGKILDKLCPDKAKANKAALSLAPALAVRSLN
jgi:hypothetical protein